MSSAVEAGVIDPPPGPRPPLGRILELEEVDTDLYIGRSHNDAAQRIYGGQAVAQALVAAGRTVTPERRIHSLHGHFIHPGNPGAPVLYHVERVRDGGSFTTRSVRATQAGATIFLLTASFQRRERGFSHQARDTSAPPPEELPTFEESVDPAYLAGTTWLPHLRANIAVDFRFPEEYPRVANSRGEARPPRQRAWVRTTERLAADPLIQAAGFAYTSDLFLLSSALPPHAVTIDEPGMQLASLDHSVWLHEEFRSDEWHLYEQEGLWTGGGRGLARGHLYDRSGVLVASTMQEGLLRLRK
ncbi:acyl-CoA thioesterase [Nocardia jinanensis]|uniref:Acyl-CoA thioesterase 2 n=1 Tax=Nocardia jinanensis TaxID=382504 RepID=A0A917RNC7_9NOCA|nr:acyl-CoA thioesterase domain-containing protein [Nocardia jinanensis]GGL15800.1 acyl-CoA thioesterase II [Nocardia jinanensis]